MREKVNSSFNFQSIGFARTPFKNKSQISKGIGVKHVQEGRLEIVPEMVEGLCDIEGFSHLFVIWVFDKAEHFNLTGRPPTDSREHGVFATRSPYRPNPVGLTVVRLLSRNGGDLFVRGVDMLDGSPILDIKPYLSSVPTNELRRGWITEVESRSSKGEDCVWSDSKNNETQKWTSN